MKYAIDIYSFLQPVCNVENILGEASIEPLERHESITRTSFVPWVKSEGDSRVFARKEYQRPKMAIGIGK
jgi:hypothetical protein